MNLSSWLVVATFIPFLAAAAPTNDPELERLLEADQADRRDPKADFDAVMQRDAQRRERVKQLVTEGRLKTSDDYFSAAMVFQHGEGEADLAQAHALATRALELDPTSDDAKWLVAASKDRLLMRQKKPQLYGTQFVKDAQGRWALYETDPSVTDAERAKWKVPPLEVSRKRAAKMNR